MMMMGVDRARWKGRRRGEARVLRQLSGASLPSSFVPAQSLPFWLPLAQCSPNGPHSLLDRPAGLGQACTTLLNGATTAGQLAARPFVRPSVRSFARSLICSR